MGSVSPFFSIVMPVYGVEKYLKQAVDSVLNQSFQDFEVILVDDCSPDQSPKICEEYAERYDAVKVIHHEQNKGLSAARNTGLKCAKGRYIWFMDSDDYVDSKLLESVYESLKENSAKVVVFGLKEEYYDANGDLKYVNTVVPEKMYLSTKQQVRKEIIELELATLYGYAWNKFYDLQYLKEIGIQYENVTLIEDISFNVKYCMDIDSMNILDVSPYHYGKRIENSLTSKFVPEYFSLHEKRVKMVYDQYQKWNMCDQHVKEKLAGIYARYLLSALQRNCDPRSQMNGKDRYQWVVSLFAEPFFQELKNHMHPSSKTMAILMPLMKNQRTRMCLAAGRMIYIVKNKLPILFAKAKESR